MKAFFQKLFKKSNKHTSYVITEGILGYWHYHISYDNSKTRALCGTKTMHTAIKIADWQAKFGEHFPKKPSYCNECDIIFKEKLQK